MANIMDGICGMGVHFTVDGFRAIYLAIAVLMWAVTTIFSKQYFSHHKDAHLKRYYIFTLLTFLATAGVFLSEDLFTTFIFFEIMSFTSYAWVAHEEKEEALRAAGTYLAIAVIGGMVLLMGLFLLYNAVGTLKIDEITAACEGYEKKGRLYAAGLCMLFGFGAKAGAFPLHIWLPKAHPVAPAPASALLSGMLTKTGIFGIIVVSCNMFLRDEAWGVLILCLGIATLLLGAVLALFSVNIKRILACSSMSQIGFILTGIGMIVLLGEENALAVRGTFLHMVNHSMIKLLLFVIAGIVFMNTGALELNRIRGFGRKKPFLNVIYLMGALAMGGIPLWSGYISKTLLHESIVEYTHLLHESPARHLLTAEFVKGAEWLFLIGGGMTVAYLTKIYICLFVEKNNDENLQKKYDSCGAGYLSLVNRAALGISAAILGAMGFFPWKVMDKIAEAAAGFFRFEGEAHRVEYFNQTNLVGGGISIAIGVLLYFLVIRMFTMKKNELGQRRYVNRWPAWLDLENAVYRPLLLQVLPFVGAVVCRVLDSLVDWVVVFLRKTVYRDRKIPHEKLVGNELTYCIGKALDAIAGFRARITKKERIGEMSFVYRVALFREKVRDNNTIIGRSLSFGLFMFCFGLALTLIYLLW